MKSLLFAVLTFVVVIALMRGLAHLGLSQIESGTALIVVAIVNMQEAVCEHSKWGTKIIARRIQRVVARLPVTEESKAMELELIDGI